MTEWNWTPTHTVISKMFINLYTRWFGSVDIFFLWKIGLLIFLFDFNCYNAFDSYWRSLHIDCCSELCLVFAGRQSVAVQYGARKPVWAIVRPINMKHHHSHEKSPTSNSTAQPTQSAALWEKRRISGQSIGAGSGRIIFKALDEPYKAYFPHTFGLKSVDLIFGLI